MVDARKTGWRRGVSCGSSLEDANKDQAGSEATRGQRFDSAVTQEKPVSDEKNIRDCAPTGDHLSVADTPVPDLDLSFPWEDHSPPVRAQHDTPVRRPPRRIISPRRVHAAVERVAHAPATRGIAACDWQSRRLISAFSRGGVPVHELALRVVPMVRARNELSMGEGEADLIEDIVLSSQKSLHVIRPIEGTNLFVYLLVTRSEGNLTEARRLLRSLEIEIAGLVPRLS